MGCWTGLGPSLRWALGADLGVLEVGPAPQVLPQVKEVLELQLHLRTYIGVDKKHDGSVTVVLIQVIIALHTHSLEEIC